MIQSLFNNRSLFRLVIQMMMYTQYEPKQAIIQLINNFDSFTIPNQYIPSDTYDDNLNTTFEVY